MATAARTIKTRSSGTDWLRTIKRAVDDGPASLISEGVAATVDIERWLQSHGVQYAPAGPIPIDLIDIKRSRSNQARKDALVPESVERFATAMRAGDPFPPIVVFPDGPRLVIIDGNNRHAAALKVGASEIYGIVVSEDTPSELIHLLTVEANARHGVTPDLAWRVQQAFGLVAMGWGDEDAGRAAGLSAAQVRAARTVQSVEARAVDLRISGFGDLPASAKVALAPVKDEAVFFNLAKLAVSTNMTTDEIRDVTRALKPLHSESARLDYVTEVAKQRNLERTTRRANGNKVGPARVTSPRVALVAGIGKVLSVRPEALVSQIATRRDKHILVSRIEELKKRLALIEVALNSLGDLETD